MLLYQRFFREHSQSRKSATAIDETIPRGIDVLPKSQITIEKLKSKDSFQRKPAFPGYPQPSTSSFFANKIRIVIAELACIANWSERISSPRVASIKTRFAVCHEIWPNRQSRRLDTRSSATF